MLSSARPLLRLPRLSFFRVATKASLRILRQPLLLFIVVLFFQHCKKKTSQNPKTTLTFEKKRRCYGTVFHFCGLLPPTFHITFSQPRLHHYVASKQVANMTFSVLHKINQRNVDVLIKGQKGLIMMRRRLKFWPCLSVANEIRHMINVRKRNLTLLHTSRNKERKYQNL